MIMTTPLLKLIARTADSENMEKKIFNYIRFDLDGGKIIATDTRKMIVAYESFPTSCKGEAYASPALMEAFAKFGNNDYRFSDGNAPFWFADNCILHMSNNKMSLDNLAYIQDEEYPRIEAILNRSLIERPEEVKEFELLYRIHQKGIMVDDEYLKDLREFMEGSRLTQNYSYYLHASKNDTPVCVECRNSAGERIFLFIVMPIIQKERGAKHGK